MVTVAWIAGKPLALLFDPFESLVGTFVNWILRGD